ncbi:xanthine dehydrogenase family protein molybdopterin-binding subunit [Megalodesulfovibrio gigas]|uniref:Putative xanthine dehydrogenase molybdenum binding subunit n=1 Tax=Megalodesulfovibrio gigas (strain ATCC 19364 / DSM 1382 / NCIMB 9332 / VKM B-1759) TaxID=1121448 RepID=T2GCB3_MEGG1|nr:xanthine dehydrogenase family protein molybdopterin-binding subunit [Megalodesulfovibrio gigas]AGW14210.1 putative xanthine dehydrogenase molybdenum binding subunit [Megalodesulfovibrio gigas DSM 1382 = ATCC 19364]
MIRTDAGSGVRQDALTKAAGRERYSIDETPPGCLWAGALRAGVPHARIVRVDTDAARRVPGVVAVLTRADVPGTNRQGIVHKDQPVLCGERVRHCGDPVALVVAESREALAAGLGRIHTEFSPLPGVFDPAAALLPEAPLVHSDHAGGNLLAQGLMEKGDASAAFADCAAIVSGRFETPMQDHVFLEPPNGLARLRPSGVLEMIVSTQAPFRDRFEIAHALGLDPMRMRIRAPFLGGGFGGKDGATVQCLLALAALHLPGRWVKMVWSREETFLAGYKRHAAVVDIRLGADADGALRALACSMLFDAGPYAHLSAEIMALGMEHAAGPYRIPHTRIEGRCAHTNNPVGGAFRGFGVVQATFAIERALDALARRLDRDPAELRRQNALHPGELNGVGVPVESGTLGTDVAACLDAAMAHPFWTEREAWQRAAPPLTRRGVGLVATHNAMGYGRGLPDHAAAKLELTRHGGFRIYNSVPDMGQGNAAAFVTLAAQALQQPETAFECLQPDTARCLPAGSSSASRTTYTFGNALLRACRSMAEKLRARAALVLLCDDPERLRLIPGAVHDPVSDRSVPLPFLASLLPRDDRLCIDQFTMPVVQNPPDTGREFRLGFPHRFYAYGACVCGVEVDVLTGQIRLARCLETVACGRVLSLVGVEQQLHGAAAQGAGLALFENMALNAGRIGGATLSAYLIPTALDLPDLPDFACLTLDDDEPTGPMGLKGMGEIGIHGPGPALAQALEHALGMPLEAMPGGSRLPLSPEAVLAALEGISS